MGLGGISLWQLLIVLLIVVMIFGTKKLRTIGGDLGGAVKGFRKAMTDADRETEPAQITDKDAEFEETSAESSDAESSRNV